MRRSKPRLARRVLGLAVLALALFATACGPNIVAIPRVGFMRPMGVASEQHFEAMRAHLLDRGYEVMIAQPNRGRLGIRARYTDGWDGRDGYGVYRFAVICERGRMCEIQPIGPRVEPVHGGYRMPEEMRDELLALRTLAQAGR